MSPLPAHVSMVSSQRLLWGRNGTSAARTSVCAIQLHAVRVADCLKWGGTCSRTSAGVQGCRHSSSCSSCSGR